MNYLDNIGLEKGQNIDCQTNQSESEILCCCCSRAESKQTGLEWRNMGNRGRGKGDSWSQTACQKKERSPATNATFLQVRQSDASGNSSFLPELEEALLTHFLLPLQLLSPQVLQNPGIKKNLFSPLFSPSFPHLPRPNSTVKLSS